MCRKKEYRMCSNRQHKSVCMGENIWIWFNGDMHSERRKCSFYIEKRVLNFICFQVVFPNNVFSDNFFDFFSSNFVFSLHFQTFAFKSAAFDYQLHTYKMSAITISIYKLGIKLLTITWYWEARTNRYLLSIDRSFVCLHTCSRTHLKTAIHESWIS